MSCILLGPRQTGKSSLVRAALADSDTWYVDLLEEETFLHFARDPGIFRREVLARAATGTRVFAVDEIQKLPALLDEIHSLIETDGLRFVMTGSSARKLRRGGANLLAGRAAMRHLHPLTVSEMGDRFDLETALRFGTLPAVAATDDVEMRMEILRGYANTYLREEIQAEAIVRNIGGFARFLDLAASNSGGLINFASLARDVAVSVKTAQEYYQILDDTLLALRLEPWRKSARARMVAQPRVYLFDTGVTNAVAGRLTAALTPDLRGRLFEQWLILEVWHTCSYHFPETRLFFWRTHSGAEVDLLLQRHGELRVAIEIKSKSHVATADLSGLRTFAEVHPTVPRLVVAPVPNAFELNGVLVLPYRQFLSELAQWLGPQHGV